MSPGQRGPKPAQWRGLPKREFVAISLPNHWGRGDMDAKSRSFTDVRAAMQRYVDQEILAGVSWTILRGRDVVDQQCVGWADREAKAELRPDHIFRAFSNTKIFVSCAIMMLVEQGRIGLDDAVEKFLPQLANRKVLKADATSLADVEPAKSRITIRHLMTHTSGVQPSLRLSGNAAAF